VFIVEVIWYEDMKGILFLTLLILPWDVGFPIFGHVIKLAHLVLMVNIFVVLAILKRLNRSLDNYLKWSLLTLVVLMLHAAVLKEPGPEIYASFAFVFNSLFFVVGAYCFGQVAMRLGAASLARIISAVILAYALAGLVELIYFTATNSFIFARFTADGGVVYYLGQFFANEPNWVALYLVFLSFFPLLYFRARNAAAAFLLVGLGVFFLVLLCQSRVALGVFVLLLFAALTRGRYYSLMVAIAGVVCASVVYAFNGLLSYLPESYVYDILDLEQNPRLFDAAFIIERIHYSGTLWFGIGFGPISEFTSEMSWRETYPVSNQLWLHFLATLGVVGLGIITALAVWGLLRTRGSRSLYYFGLIALALQFHNFFFRPMFFSLIAIGVVSYVLERRLRVVESGLPGWILWRTDERRLVPEYKIGAY
jgi:hypothetical protein